MELDVASVRRPRRAARPAEDPGRAHAREEPPVEAGVTREHRAVAGVVVEHTSSLPGQGGSCSRFSDIKGDAPGANALRDGAEPGWDTVACAAGRSSWCADPRRAVRASPVRPRAPRGDGCRQRRRSSSSSLAARPPRRSCTARSPSWRSTGSTRRRRWWRPCTRLASVPSATSTSGRGSAGGRTRSGSRGACSASPTQGGQGSDGSTSASSGVLLPIMATRLARCVKKGFDAVDPDNVEGYENATGFPLDHAEQLAYDRAIAALSRTRRARGRAQELPRRGRRARGVLRLRGPRAVRPVRAVRGASRRSSPPQGGVRHRVHDDPHVLRLPAARRGGPREAPQARRVGPAVPPRPGAGRRRRGSHRTIPPPWRLDRASTRATAVGAAAGDRPVGRARPTTPGRRSRRETSTGIVDEELRDGHRRARRRRSEPRRRGRRRRAPPLRRLRGRARRSCAVAGAELERGARRDEPEVARRAAGSRSTTCGGSTRGSASTGTGPSRSIPASSWGSGSSAIESAGLFVPSGKGSFPSVLVQLAVPAIVAGVPTIVVVVPPRARRRRRDRPCGARGVPPPRAARTSSA